MQQFDELKKERMQLAAERISEIVTEAAIPAPFARYFKEEAEFISQMLDLAETIRTKQQTGHYRNGNSAIRECMQISCRSSMNTVLAIRSMQ